MWKHSKMLCFPLDVAVRGKTLLKLVFYITSVLICVSYLKKKSKITFSASLSSHSKYTQIEHMCLEISFYVSWVISVASTVFHVS